MAKKKKQWIQRADLKAGALSEQAQRAGYTTWQEYCSECPNLSPLTEKRCNLAKTLSKLSRKNK